MATIPTITTIRGDGDSILGYRVEIVIDGTTKCFFCKLKADAEAMVREYLSKVEAKNG